MRTLLLLPALAILAACATTREPPEPVIKVVEVLKPTPVPCKALEDLDSDPEYVDSDAALSAAPDVRSKVQLLVKGRLQRITRLAEYAAVKTACVF